MVELLHKSAIFDVFHRFCRHDDFENLLMNILKVELFYPPMDGVPTLFRNFFDVKIAICYEQTLLFSRFFFKPATLNSCIDETHCWRRIRNEHTRK